MGVNHRRAPPRAAYMFSEAFSQVASVQNVPSPCPSPVLRTPSPHSGERGLATAWFGSITSAARHDFGMHDEMIARLETIPGPFTPVEMAALTIQPRLDRQRLAALVEPVQVHRVRKAIDQFTDRRFGG